MLRYIAQRLAWALLLLWLVTLITFALTHIVPGDPATFMAGDNATKASLAAMRLAMGLDKPLTSQYWLYLSGLSNGDFGQSLRTGRAVSSDLRYYLPASIELALVSLLLYAVVAISLGSIAAAKRGRAVDLFIRVFSIFGSALPVFWVALIMQEVFFARLGWLPFGGRLDIGATPPTHITGLYTVDSLLTGNWTTLGSAVAHLALPVATNVLAMLAIGLRSTRASVITELSSNYVRTARSKGVGGARLYFVHVIRNALNPVVSLMSLQAGHLLGWLVLVETVFDWPGLGLYAYQSIQDLDYAPIMALTLIISATFIVVNLLSDLIYPILDPRLRTN